MDLEKEQLTTEEMPTIVDVIIPVYHPDEKLLELLKSLKSQSLRPAHIILLHTVAEGAEANQDWEKLGISRAELEEQIPQLMIREIPQKEFDHGKTRDLGVQLSSAPLFMMMTQDAIPQDHQLIELMQKSMAADIAAVYAKQLPNRDCNEPERYTRHFNYPSTSRKKTLADLPELGIKTYFCSNVCAMYQRSVYDKLGGFLKHTIFNEDMIYAGTAVKAGYAIYYCAEAAVIHSHNYSAGMLLRRSFDIGVSQSEHPEIFEGISSESEGGRLVGKTIAYLNHNNGRLLVLPYIWQCGCRYLGFRLGKRYRSLPVSWRRTLSMNRAYWSEDRG